ncbi:hypothetical protein PX554_22565 [Sphingomonas sp. H39-1-10]|uniref:hypothetical protein n=1 Tax=Sphingomonas pollutisoli TaxID=3030829 RepID=UPI0023B8ACAC|nr:hypothetical protein [Sphingomonas pollutisoli]MDF0490918.1 hypothetical protein [Sphingomonas pollutisoli]
MLGLALLLQATGDLPPLPTDWSTLAPIPYVDAPTLTAPLVKFVAGEIAAGRCAVPKPADGHYVVKVDVATLVDQDGTLRRAVPRAIDCPTVEQYSAGLVSSFARANLNAGTVTMWYRATLVYDWHG